METTITRRLRTMLIAFTLIFAAWPAVNTASAASALVLYDDRPNDEFGKLGYAYSIMLRNLLGHFQGMSVDMVPVQNYSSGTINNHDVTFYLGTYFDNPLPANFLTDVINASKTVVWFRSNIWQLAWDPTFGFTNKYGLQFNGLASYNAIPSASNPDPGFYNTISYKGKSFIKFYSFDSASGVGIADPDAGIMQIVDPAKAQTLVQMSNPALNQVAPYIVRSGNFWYVADVPFSFIDPKDRYTVFCDIIHDMVGSNHGEQHNALIRLEDVGALVNKANMKTLSDYFSSKQIPFSIALMPFYRDPLGKFNGGTPMEVHLADATDLLASVAYAQNKGGSVLMHGYTHQYNSMLNPHSAVTGDDYEFWDIVNNQPVAEDSVTWALARLDAGLAEMAGVGLTPFAWETPHYHASPKSHQAFVQRFDTAYMRAVYFTSSNPDLNPNNPTRDIAVGQFFPYVIYNDFYGQKIIPENLGNIEYDISDIDPSSNFNFTADDLIANADYSKVIRDSYASFFFHPFWLEKDLNQPGFKDLKKTINGIQSLGYQFVDPRGL